MDPDGLLFSLRTGLGDVLAETGLLPFLLAAVGAAVVGTLLFSVGTALVHQHAARRAVPPTWADEPDDEPVYSGPVPRVERIAMAFPSAMPSVPVPRIGFHAAQPLAEAGRPTYPRITAPRPASVVKGAEEGRTGTTSLLAHRMARLLARHLGETVRVETRARLAGPTGLPFFEPDLVLIHRDARLRLHLAIEIDAPYDADGPPRNTLDAQGRPSHERRDRQMAARGWVVVRFSEEQVVRDPNGCCCYLAEVLRALVPGWAPPPNLETIPMLEAQLCWSVAEAHAWAASHRRERYLGLPHLPVSETPLPDLVRKQSDEAEAVEAAVAEAYPELTVSRVAPATPRALPPRAPVTEGPIEARSADMRLTDPVFTASLPMEALRGDGASGMPPRLEADQAESRALPFLDTHLDRLFPAPDLDARAVAMASSRACQEDPRHPCFGMPEEEIARRLHEAHARAEKAERAMRTGRPGAAEARLMRDFFEAHPTLRVERTRWQVNDGTAEATVDALCRRPDGLHVLVRWTRARVLRLEAPDWAAPPLGHLPNTVVWRAAVETSWLRRVLAEHYGIEVADAYLVALHPERTRAEALTLPKLDLPPLDLPSFDQEPCALTEESPMRLEPVWV